MMKRIALPGLAVAAALSAATCFDPDYQAGLECSSDGECPSGFECASDGLCYQEGEGPPDASMNGGDGGDTDGGLPASCDPLDQSSCPTGTKCSFVVESSGPPLQGRIACVPDGNGAPGDPCAFNQPFVNGSHDSCERGLVCSGPDDGACTPLCDPTGPPACGQNEGAVCVRPGTDTFQVNEGPAPFGTCTREVTVDIASGPLHTCALSNGGRVRCWGANSHGQLGLPNVTNVGLNQLPDEVDFVELGDRAVDIDTGGVPCVGDGCSPALDVGHTCAVLQSGDVRCWGANSHGQLGLGHTESVGREVAPTEFPPVNVGGEAVAVSLGWTHTCVLLDSGSVKCWGDNDRGQLGHQIEDPQFGDTQDDGIAELSPVELDAAVVEEIAAGDTRTCVRTTESLVHCWGGPGDSLGYANRSATDDLGDDEAPASEASVEVPPAQAVGAGLQMSCSSNETRVSCWGYEGEQCLALGDPDNDGITGDNEGIPVIDLNVEIRQLELAGRLQDDQQGNLVTCPETWALDAGGEVRTWGADAKAAPAFRFGNPDFQIIQLAVGRDHQCALEVDPTDSGLFPEVYCYGKNDFGQLGQGDTDLADLAQEEAAEVFIF